MKFKFINKAKDINPTDIQAKMNFGKVAQSAKALSSAKLSAGILKLGTSTVTTVVTTSAVVVTAVTIGVTNPEIFKQKVIEEQPVIEEVVEQAIPDPVEEQPALVVQEPEEETPELEAAPEEEEIKEIIETPEAIISQVDSIANVEIVNSASENIFISPTPLPSEDAFFAFIEKELKYPVEHLEEPIEGIVEVRFTVNKEGKAVNFKIKKSLGELFDNEAIRVLRKYQNWQPASLNGQAVEYNMDIKVRFETK